MCLQKFKFYTRKTLKFLIQDVKLSILFYFLK